MADRTIVILHTDPANAANVAATASAFAAAGVNPVVAAGAGCSAPEGFESRAVPEESLAEPKARNWALGEFSSGGFLHVVSDKVKVVKDPAAFLSDLESAMRALDYPVWLSTTSDPCNYVYGTLNPRVRVCMDRPECAAAGLRGEVWFTSHSNTMWMAYDTSHPSVGELGRLDERFTVPMFYIIELLARRKASRADGQLFYMNQYMTVGSELGVFEVPPAAGPGDQVTQETMKAEDELFRSLGLDTAPDNDVDALLESLWRKIQSVAAPRV